MCLMEFSQNANVVEIRRLVEKFNETSLNCFKQCLCKELGCDNQRYLLSHFVKYLPQSIGSKSIACVRNTAIKLAESQRVYTTTVIGSGQQQHSYSLHKWIHSQYKDNLSRLASDIIDNIACYLNKQESIIIGYLNRQLYIESQKQSYIIKRQQSDVPFVLNDELIDNIDSKLTI